MPVSRNTLLRLVRATPRPEQGPPRVLGVDDWAKRKGSDYGTILVDLEKRCPIELLPDREADTLARWLRTHPGVEVIARDRAAAYAEGAKSGAPDAVQIADRFHLLQNFVRVVQNVFEKHPKHLRLPDSLKDLPGRVSDPNLRSNGSIPPAPQVISLPPLPTADSQARRARRLVLFERVQELHQQGWTFCAIARHLQVDRKTVRRYAQAQGFPERQQPRGILDSFKPYVLSRWNEGCRTGTRLLEEIKQRGYQGGRTTLFNYVSRLRAAQGLPPRSRHFQRGRVVVDRAIVKLTPRKAAFLVVRKPEKLTEEDEVLIRHLREAHPDLREVISLAQAFVRMLRNQASERFDGWLARAAGSSIAAFRGFARSLKRDYDAVLAALVFPWSTSPVEGHINKLKTLKRQMFGRAKLDLLEQRLLGAA